MSCSLISFQKLKQSICPLSCGLWWAKGSTRSVVFTRWRQWTVCL